MSFVKYEPKGNIAYFIIDRESVANGHTAPEISFGV